MEDRKHIGPTRTDAGRETIKMLGNPRDIQRQNTRTILAWLYRWGFSTADILSGLLGRKNQSHARRLAKDGLIRSVSIKGYPTYYVLTERGLAEAIHHSMELYEYREIDPYRVHLPILHHNLIAQREAIAAIENVGCSEYWTERMYKFNKNDVPLKVPDVILVNRVRSEFGLIVDELVGVEVELTPKWNHKLDLFVTNIVDDIQFGRLRMFLIFSDSPAILNRYLEAFKPGKKVRRWENLPGGKVKDTGETLVIPEWAFRYIHFREVGSTEPYPTLDLLGVLFD